MTKGYIYKITNKLNNNLYVGQTSRSINERFAEHLRDAFNKTSNQPLYSAIRKYGKEAFMIELLEECSSDIINEREIYYINTLDSYNNGYNATLGGEGKPVNNYETIVQEFLASGKSIATYSKEHNMKEVTLRNALNNLGLMNKYREMHPEFNNRFNTISVNMLDKETNLIIKTFNSINDAIKKLNITKDKGHIKAVCQGKRNSAYGYKWSFAN